MKQKPCFKDTCSRKRRMSRQRQTTYATHPHVQRSALLHLATLTSPSQHSFPVLHGATSYTHINQSHILQFQHPRKPSHRPSPAAIPRSCSASCAARASPTPPLSADLLAASSAARPQSCKIPCPRAPSPLPTAISKSRTSRAAAPADKKSFVASSPHPFISLFALKTNPESAALFS